MTEIQYKAIYLGGRISNSGIWPRPLSPSSSQLIGGQVLRFLLLTFESYSLGISHFLSDSEWGRAYHP